MAELKNLGQRIPRQDALEKVTGSAKYASDIKLPHMLYGKILRSTQAHAKIVKIDTTAAERLPGVKAIVTAEDTPKIPYSLMAPAFADKLPLADKKVRFIGDEVAAVAAVDERTAEEALRLIKVEYEDLPALFDPIEAMKDDAPLIHQKKKNVATYHHWELGSTAKGFKEADHIFENTFKTHSVTHCTLESHSIVAHYDVKGNLTLWSSTQSPYYVRLDLARVLKMPIDKIRLRETFVGGGFGGKSRITEDAICALLAKKSARPVKLILSRDEEFVGTRHRHPTMITLKTGVTKEGLITAMEQKIIVDCGAYNDYGHSVSNPKNPLTRLYKIPNIKLEGFAVYTNNPFGGRFRSYKGTPSIFALDCQMDIIATDLGIDPKEFLLKNAVYQGWETTDHRVMGSCGLQECIKKVTEAIGWEEKKRDKKPQRGVGIACMVHGGGGIAGDGSAALVKIEDGGKVTVISGAAEIGGGEYTVLAQICAEEFGVPVEDVTVKGMDTEVAPLEAGSRASRFTFMGGNAVKRATAEAKKRLLEIAAEKLEESPENLETRNGRIQVKGSPDKFLTFAEAVIKVGRPVETREEKEKPMLVAHPIMGAGAFEKELKSGLVNVHGVQAVEVEVDRETGRVDLLRFVAAHDCGRVINLNGVEGQIEGGISQGIGYALMENLMKEGGRVLNSNFTDYKIPTALDMPPITAMAVETRDPYGPFGAKGIGEPPGVPTAPALINAIYDAIGIRFKELPVTPEKILKALQEREGGN